MARWEQFETAVGKNGFGEIDPYIDWAFEPSKLPPGFLVRLERYPLLLKLRHGLSAQDFAAGKFFKNQTPPSDWTEVVRVPPLYLSGSNTTYMTALVRPKFFVYFDDEQTGENYSSSLFGAIARMAISEYLPDQSVPKNLDEQTNTTSNTPDRDPEPGTVVVGVIDDGLAFANDRFRTADNKSRVEAIWLQDNEYNGAAQRYGYGRVLSKYDLNDAPGLDTLVSQSTYCGIVDEDEVYRNAGALDFGRESTADAGQPDARKLRTIALRASHGTHVMDLACGYAPGDAPKCPGTKGEDNRPIVCVQLPAATHEGTSGASLDTYAIDAIRFIFEQADEIARKRGCRPLPLVINFSFGLIAGSHDGTSDIELAIDELVRLRKESGAPTEVVIPAGNHRLKQCHATFKLPTKPSSENIPKLDWRVLPDTRSRSHLELWISGEAQQDARRIKIRITPPNGVESPPLEERKNGVLVWGESPAKGVCYARYSYFPAPVSRAMFLITLEATEPTIDTSDSFRPVRPPAEAGVWQIKLENVDPHCDHTIEAWVQRNDTRFGHLPFGRQSYIDDACYVEFGANGRVPENDSDQSVVKRSGTLNAIATGRQTIVVGGYLGKEMSVADYSGEGPTDAENRVGPDAAAPSDDSIIHRGVVAAGTKSGSRVFLNGTSVAAPQVTRLIANRMAAKEPADRQAISELAECYEDHRLCSVAKVVVRGGDITSDDKAALLKHARPPIERAGGGRLPKQGQERVSRIFIDEI